MGVGGDGKGDRGRVEEVTIFRNETAPVSPLPFVRFGDWSVSFLFSFSFRPLVSDDVDVAGWYLSVPRLTAALS